MATGETPKQDDSQEEHVGADLSAETVAEIDGALVAATRRPVVGQLYMYIDPEIYKQ